MTLTATKALTEVGAFVGSAFGTPGELIGAVLGSRFGAGGNIAYVNATHSVSIGVTGTFAPAQIGGGGGFSLSHTPVPATLNANSIANGTSYGDLLTADPKSGFGWNETTISVFGTADAKPISSHCRLGCIWNCGHRNAHKCVLHGDLTGGVVQVTAMVGTAGRVDQRSIRFRWGAIQLRILGVIISSRRQLGSLMGYYFPGVESRLRNHGAFGPSSI